MKNGFAFWSAAKLLNSRYGAKAFVQDLVLHKKGRLLHFRFLPLISPA